MINDYNARHQICLHCMGAYVIGGRCQRCGKPNTDERRPPTALPFGYKILTPRRRCYQLGRVLGSGGFGITYLAWDQQGSRPVALKELFPSSFSRDPITMAIKYAPKDAAMFHHFRKRFVDEARIIALLRNEPDIINIYDYFEMNETGYYVMEYLHGMDMQHWLRRKQAPLTWKELESPLRQVLHCLSILHTREFIHRDISPDNIFICQDGTAKLIDFGSVRNQNADHFTTILKRSYAPPEQLISDGNQGPWTDLFSLCASVYYLLSAEHPIPSFERVALRETNGTDPLVPLEQHNPDAPEYVIKATMYGMNLDETNRFRSVEEMTKAFFPDTQSEPADTGCILECVSGVFVGRRFPVTMGKYISVGRGDSKNNTISFPMNTPAVSRPHCLFYYHSDGKLYIQDQQSRFGTFLGRNRIPPMRWIPVQPGQLIRFGREVFVFKTP